MNLPLNIDIIENTVYEGITVGQSARLLRTLTPADGPVNRVASALLALLAAHNARRDQPRQVC